GSNGPNQEVIPVQVIGEGVREALEVSQVGVVVTWSRDKQNRSQQRCAGFRRRLIGVVDREETGAVLAHASGTIYNVAGNEDEVGLCQESLHGHRSLGWRALPAISEQRKAEWLGCRFARPRGGL